MGNNLRWFIYLSNPKEITHLTVKVWLEQFKSISNQFIQFQNLYSISYSEAVISSHRSIGFPPQMKLAQTRTYGYICLLIRCLLLKNVETVKRKILRLGDL